MMPKRQRNNSQSPHTTNPCKRLHRVRTDRARPGPPEPEQMPGRPASANALGDPGTRAGPGASRLPRRPGPEPITSPSDTRQAEAQHVLGASRAVWPANPKLKDPGRGWGRGEATVGSCGMAEEKQMHKEPVTQLSRQRALAIETCN
jgi:hypothetical protein